jgi:hypothetical protein
LINFRYQIFDKFPPKKIYKLIFGIINFNTGC